VVKKYEYKLEKYTLGLLAHFQKFLDFILTTFYNLHKLDRTTAIIGLVVMTWIIFMINFNKVPFNL